MNISEVMSLNVRMIDPEESLVQAARSMDDLGVGTLPVAENDRLIGMITDRDIVLRGVASGKDVSATRVREAMSDEVLYCFDDQPVAEVTSNMGLKQVRRLPVVNRDKKLVGIVSLGDIATSDANAEASAALASISDK